MATIFPVTDLSAPELAVFTSLTQAQLRNRLEPEKGIFIAESPKVITLALEAGLQPLSFLMEEKHIEGQAKELIARCDVPVYTASREVLAALTGYELTRGILCAFRRPQERSLEAVCRDARRIAVLWGIVDSTNVGAIFRSAAALGIDAVVVSQDCCDPLCRRAIRVSMGTVFQVPWATIPSVSALQELGFSVAAMALTDASIPLGDPRLSDCEKLAVVLGNEGSGLPQSIIDACDHTVRIPMAHGVDSLNVAAAGAVTFWEICKKFT